jgi:hypothetical protein
MPGKFAEPVFHAPLRAENCGGNSAAQGMPQKGSRFQEFALGIGLNGPGTDF